MCYCCMFLTFTACERADAICRQADVVAALSLEVLKGTSKAFDSGMLIIDLKSVYCFYILI